MRGIGNKLLLLLPGVGQRFDGAVCKGTADKKMAASVTLPTISKVVIRSNSVCYTQ